MDLGIILIYSLLLFAIIYFSVSLAIAPLLNKSEESLSLTKNLGLVKLRDIKVFSNDELEEVIKLYQNIGTRKDDYEQYQKYANVLNELKEIGYLSDKEYLIKLSKLKEHFKVE